MRRPLPAVLRFRGGEECWVEIEARGQKFRFPGPTAIYDALAKINGVSWIEE